MKLSLTVFLSSAFLVAALPKVGDRIEFTKDIYVFPNATAAWVASTESVKEFLTVRQCDVGLLGPTPMEESLPKSTVEAPRRYEVTQVSEHVAFPLYHVQSGLVLQLKPLFEGSNRIKFLICLKEWHEEWPAESPKFSEEDLRLTGEFMRLEPIGG